MPKIVGNAAYVRLTRRAPHEKWQYALVDVEDYERVVKSKWCARRNNSGFYAVATSLKYLPAHHRKLQNLVMRIEPGQVVDHKNGDTLDNRKQNLRLCTPAQNAKNVRRSSSPGKSSKFKGVYWSKSQKAWIAQITSDGTTHRLGAFKSEVKAAEAYDEAAIRLHGEFARTNAVMKLYEQDTPYIPDVSKASEVDRIVPDRRRHRSMTSKSNYYQRLDRQLFKELEALEAKAR